MDIDTIPQMYAHGSNFIVFCCRFGIDILNRTFKITMELGEFMFISVLSVNPPWRRQVN